MMRWCLALGLVLFAIGGCRSEEPSRTAAHRLCDAFALLLEDDALVIDQPPYEVENRGTAITRISHNLCVYYKDIGPWPEVPEGFGWLQDLRWALYTDDRDTARRLYREAAARVRAASQAPFRRLD